jgi:hypothetical protein
MYRLAIVAVAVVLVLLAAAQFVVPSIIEGAVEDRLTERGGKASVELDGVPWPRLMFKEGDRFTARASGIEAPLLESGAGRLDDLDGFGEVDVRITDSRAGPFRVASLTLARAEGDGAYDATVNATITGGDLAAYAGGQFGGSLGGFLAGMAGGILPGSDKKVPIELDAVLRSQGGKARAVTVHGTVAGLPAGPVIELIATTLAVHF